MLLSHSGPGSRRSHITGAVWLLRWTAGRGACVREIERRLVGMRAPKRRQASAWEGNGAELGCASTLAEQAKWPCARGRRAPAGATHASLSETIRSACG